MHRRLLTAVVGLTAAGLLLTGCSSDPTTSVDAAPAPQVSEPSDLPAVVEPSLEDSPSPSVAPTSAAPSPKPAAPTYDVAAVQRQLTDLNYYVGAIDGERGPALRSAVMAFQKVQGLGADGVVGKMTLAALKAPKAPKLKASSPSNRVEVDLTKQVLYVVKGGQIARILPVSSGNGERYTQKSGGKARALTPVGWYKIQRRIVGVREADLGTLYDPQYFYRGWAIHGSNSVPAYPASHGCVRVTRADAKWLLRNISVGMSVYLYGGEHTFPAGSAAPGTDNPTGDTGSESSPSPSASPSKPPSKPASPKPSPSSPPPTTVPSTTPRPTPTATS